MIYDPNTKQGRWNYRFSKMKNSVSTTVPTQDLKFHYLVFITAFSLFCWHSSFLKPESMRQLGWYCFTENNFT